MTLRQELRAKCRQAFETHAVPALLAEMAAGGPSAGKAAELLRRYRDSALGRATTEKHDGC